MGHLSNLRLHFGVLNIKFRRRSNPHFGRAELRESAGPERLGFEPAVQIADKLRVHCHDRIIIRLNGVQNRRFFQGEIHLIPSKVPAQTGPLL
jgi:hypothetical protein